MAENPTTLAWLRQQLAAVDSIAGGYHRKMGHPVASFAYIAMSAVLVVFWAVLALPVMAIRATVRAVCRA